MYSYGQRYASSQWSKFFVDSRGAAILIDNGTLANQIASSSIQSTPALRTPRYYGHPAIMDSSKIPGESYRRWNKLPLLRTHGNLIRSQRHNFIVFSLVIADTEQHLGIFAHISSLFFLLFEAVDLVDFRFFCPSIKIPSSFSLKALFAVSLP